MTIAAIPAWAGLSARERSETLARRRAMLAADLCIEGRAEERALVPLHEHSAALAELDDLLELDGDDLPLRLLRALTWFDAGDATRAKADFAALAEHGGTPYLQAIAARYAATTSTGVDLADLPDPTTRADCFVAGFHALRARDCALADTLLTRAADWLPARDLRLLAILGKQPPEPDRAFAEAKELEGIYGRPTARTRHVLAAAMLQRQQWTAAIPFAEDALRLRPDRHGPCNNLGLACLRLHRHEEALRWFQRAVELRPHFANSLSGLGQTQRALGRFDDARVTFHQIADPGWREHELGNLELQRAIDATTAGDRTAAITAATTARAHFAAAAATKAGASPRSTALPQAQALAEALLAGKAETLLVPFLTQMRHEPRNARQIANLAGLLEQGRLDARAIALLRLWLLDLAIDLAPDAEALREQRQRLLQSLRSPR